MTFEPNIKCLWQLPATSNHLEITKLEWSEIFDPFVITAHSLRQMQPGNWKNPIKPETEQLTNLLSAVQKLTKLPQVKNTHPLTRHLVKELIHQCQSSVPDDQATSPKRNKTNYSQNNSMVEVSYFENLIWHFFGDTGCILASLTKILTSF